MREPIQTAREVAEAKPEAGGEGVAPRARGVNQPDQSGEGDDEQGQGMHRRQPRRRRRAEERRHRRRAPAGEGAEPRLQLRHDSAIRAVVREPRAARARDGCAGA